MTQHKQTYLCSECGEMYEDTPMTYGNSPHPRKRCELRLRRIIERLEKELSDRHRAYERLCQEALR